MFHAWRFWLLIGLTLYTSCTTGQATAPDKFPDVSQRAAAAFADNRLEDAARLYREAVKLRPDWDEGWGYLAASLFTMNKYAEARDAYRHTTLLTPKNGPSWAYLGFCEYELRNYRQAAEHLIKGQQLGLGDSRPLLSKVHYQLGMLYDTAGQFEIGAKELTFFTKIDDKTPAVIEAIGLNVLRMPVFPYEIPPAKHDLVMQAGVAGWNAYAHHVEDALKSYKELIAAYPNEPNLHYGYGFVLALSDQEAAVAELQKEIEISPGHVPAMIEAAFLCVEMGELEKSEQLARRALALEPKNYAPHNILGRVLMQTGHSEQGIKELETAVRLAPTVSAAHFNLAQAYQKAGRTSDAAREFATFKQLKTGQEGQNAASAQPQ